MTYKAPKTSRHSGQVVKKLTVYSNDSSNPTTSLTIKVKAGYEAAKFEVNPEKADFGNVLLGKKEDMKVKLKNTDSTTSNLVIIDYRKLSCNKVFNNRPDLRSCGVMININSNLAETHKGSHADSTYYKGVYLVFREQVYGNHASSLNMLFIA